MKTHNHTGWTPNATNTRIVICRRCEGRGYFAHHEPLDGHGKEYHTTTTPCVCCKGSGRMISKLTLSPWCDIEDIQTTAK